METNRPVARAFLVAALLCQCTLPSYSAHHSVGRILQLHIGTPVAGFHKGTAESLKLPADTGSYADDTQLKTDYSAPASGSADAGRTASHADYLDEISSEGIYRWRPDKFPIKVFIEDSSGVPGYRSSFRDTLVRSFDEWEEASQGRVSWQEVKTRDAANIVCNWTDQDRELAAGTEAGRTKTYTTFDTSTNIGVIKRATMTLHTRLPEREFTAQEVEKAYLHEVGHAFGLAGHSPNRSDIMNASVNHSQRPQLSIRDINTINRLYSDYMPPVTASSNRSPGNVRRL